MNDFKALKANQNRHKKNYYSISDFSQIYKPNVSFNNNNNHAPLKRLNEKNEIDYLNNSVISNKENNASAVNLKHNINNNNKQNNNLKNFNLDESVHTNFSQSTENHKCFNSYRQDIKYQKIPLKVKNESNDNANNNVNNNKDNNMVLVYQDKYIRRYLVNGRHYLESNDMFKSKYKYENNYVEDNDDIERYINNMKLNYRNDNVIYNENSYNTHKTEQEKQLISVGESTLTREIANSYANDNKLNTNRLRQLHPNLLAIIKEEPKNNKINEIKPFNYNYSKNINNINNNKSNDVVRSKFVRRKNISMDEHLLIGIVGKIDQPINNLVREENKSNYFFKTHYNNNTKNTDNNDINDNRLSNLTKYNQNIINSHKNKLTFSEELLQENLTTWITEYTNYYKTTSTKTTTYIKDNNNKIYFLNNQNEITLNKRNALIGWMYDICNHYNLDNELALLIFELFDEIIEKKDNLKIVKSQSLLVSCFFIASKYTFSNGKVDANKFIDFIYDKISVTEFLALEVEVLKTVGFISNYNTKSFFDLIFIKLNMSELCWEIHNNKNNKLNNENNKRDSISSLMKKFEFGINDDDSDSIVDDNHKNSDNPYLVKYSKNAIIRYQSSVFFLYEFSQFYPVYYLKSKYDLIIACFFISAKLLNLHDIAKLINKEFLKEDELVDIGKVLISFFENEVLKVMNSCLNKLISTKIDITNSKEKERVREESVLNEIKKELLTDEYLEKNVLGKFNNVLRSLFKKFMNKEGEGYNVMREFIGNLL